MTKTKLKTIATAVKKVTLSDTFISQCRSTIFCRLVAVAKSRDIDLKKVLPHELSNIPLSLAGADGTLNKVTKSKLMAKVVGQIHICNPKNKTALIIFVNNYLVDKASSPLQLGNILFIGDGSQNSDQAMSLNASMIQSLTCNNEEADTRMLLQASHAVGMLTRVVIVSPD